MKTFSQFVVEEQQRLVEDSKSSPRLFLQNLKKFMAASDTLEVLMKDLGVGHVGLEMEEAEEALLDKARNIAKSIQDKKAAMSFAKEIADIFPVNPEDVLED